MAPDLDMSVCPGRSDIASSHEGFYVSVVGAASNALDRAAVAVEPSSYEAGAAEEDQTCSVCSAQLTVKLLYISHQRTADQQALLPVSRRVSYRFPFVNKLSFVQVVL